MTDAQPRVADSDDPCFLLERLNELAATGEIRRRHFYLRHLLIGLVAVYLIVDALSTQVVGPFSLVPEGHLDNAAHLVCRVQAAFSAFVHT
jgi:hypothetical protein